jgi:chemotaxis signal transduction protein
MLSETALALRREFDLSFAQARRTTTPNVQHLLTVRVNGDPYALRMEEIAGLFVDRPIISIPTSMPDLLGAVAFRSQVASVFDLARLLGYAGHRAARWLILVRHQHPVALAVDAFQGQMTVTSDEVMPLSAAALHSVPERPALRCHVDHAVRKDGTIHPIIRLASVIEEIQRRVDSTRYAQEQ